MVVGSGLLCNSFTPFVYLRSVEQQLRAMEYGREEFYFSASINYVLFIMLWMERSNVMFFVRPWHRDKVCWAECMNTVMKFGKYWTTQRPAARSEQVVLGYMCSIWNHFPFLHSFYYLWRPPPPPPPPPPAPPVHSRGTILISHSCGG